MPRHQGACSQVLWPTIQPGQKAARKTGGLTALLLARRKGKPEVFSYR